MEKNCQSPPKLDSDKKSKVVIAGSEKEFEEAIFLLKKVTENKIVAGRIETDKVLSKNTIASFHHFTQLFSFLIVDEIIFCEGQISFKKIISAMQKVPGDVSIKIFAKGSHDYYWKWRKLCCEK